MQKDAADIDKQHVEQFLAGDKSAAEKIVRTHGGWMLALARRFVKDESIAEDCVQEAFLNAFRKLETFEKRSSLKTWLHRIVVNASLMKLRSSNKYQESSIDEYLPQFDTNACRIEAPWMHLATPAEILERSEKRSLIKTKIEELPDNYRIVLLLRDIEELSTSETAKLLNISEGAVKVKLHRARSALKKLLEPILREEI